MNSERFTVGLIFLCYLLLSITFSSNFFSFANLGSHCMTDGDPALNAWALAWVSRAITTDPLNLFDGNTFYPYPRSIALSEHMFSLALINTLFRPFSTNPWVGYNLLILLSYFLSCVGGFLLIKERTGSMGAGFWGGIFWGFLFFRVHHIGHMQILSFQWIPFAILYLIRFAQHHNVKDGLLFSLFFLLQALVSWYLAVITTFMVIIVGAFFSNRQTFSAKSMKKYLMILGVCISVIAPFTLPYFRSLKDSSLSLRLEQAVARQDLVSIGDYLTPPTATILGQLVPNNKYWIWEENTLYIGYVPLLLTALYLVFFFAFGHSSRFKSSTEMGRRCVYASLTLIAAGFILAMGFTSAKWGIRLPLYYLSKLFSLVGLMQATQRFSLMIYTGILIISGISLAALLMPIKRTIFRVLLPVMLSGCFLFEVYPFKLPISPKQSYRYSDIDQFIAEYQQTAGKRLAVLHYPIYYFVQKYPVREAKYMVDSTLHWAKIVNGFSAELPTGFIENMRILNTIPSQESIALIRKWDIDLIAVHAQTRSEAKEEIRQHFSTSRKGKILQVNDQEFVIHLNKNLQ